MELVLNGACEKCGGVLEECLPSVRIRALSLRDNVLEADAVGVVAALARVPALKRVDFG